MKTDFIPHGSAELYRYLTILREQLTSLPSGFLPADVQTSMEANIDNIKQSIEIASAAEAAYHSSIENKKMVIAEEIKKLRESIQIIKHYPTYTEAIGHSLDIIGSKRATNWAMLKPTAKLKKLINGVKIKYIRGRADGAFIFCKRGAETDFTHLQKVNRNEYIDTRSNLDGIPETREYYLVFCKNDEPIGIQSDILRIRV